MSKTNGQEPNPREIVLSGGRTLTINLNQLNWREAREYTAGVPPFDPTDPEKSSDAERRHAELKGKACGMTADEIQALGFEDFMLLSQKISDLIIKPVESDPS